LSILSAESGMPTTAVIDATQPVPFAMATNVTNSGSITSGMALANDDETSESEVPICVICRDDLNGNPSGAEALMCGHAFHSKYVRSWWRMKPSAPKRCGIRKQEIFAEEDDEEPAVFVPPRIDVDLAANIAVSTVTGPDVPPTTVQRLDVP
jgi:hypothetical protein